jgi:hypothetical protein
MAKPLKFYQTLNQAPRSVKHGTHRRTSPPAHGSAIVGADYGPGGSDQGTVWITWAPGGTFNSTVSAVDFARPEPQPIPYAGIRTGEIIAYRAWFVVNNYELRSLAHHFIWVPGEAVHGDVLKIIDDMQNLFRVRLLMGGVYAHTDIALTIDDVREEWSVRYPRQMEREHPQLGWVPSSWDDPVGSEATVEVDTFLGMAIGAVKLWGEVVEHERGYRAEHAKIVSIDAVCGVVDIERLRAKYLGSANS